MEPPNWRQVALLASIPVLLWMELIYKLTTDWSTNAQYEFGYFVPVFIVYLLGRRWVVRPDPSDGRIKRVAYVAGPVLLLILLPLRVVQEANPDWRPLNWFHGAVVVSFTLVPVALVGGWSWVRHFSFPLLLIFSTLPWPLATEQAALQTLSGAVTAVTVELLNLINIPALQRGNVIDLAVGSVGIADACSGIRSLAGTLMASLFFGEFYRLGIARRIGLVLGGCTISFALNLCRAFFLSWRAASEGIHSIERWHDPAGFTIFLISFASLWLFANLMTRGDEHSELPARPPISLVPFSGKWLVASLLWVLGVEVASESWYRYREGKQPTPLTWEIKWPERTKSLKFDPIPDETRSILRYTNGKSAAVLWEDGSSWQAFYFYWAPGRTSVQLSTMHRPEICLPAVGYKYVSEAKPVDVSAADLSLTFTGSVFDYHGNTVYVYRSLSDDFPNTGLNKSKSFDMSVRGRLLGAWYGRRNLGQRMLQVAMIGLRSEEDAHAQLKDHLAEMLVPKGAG